MGYDLYILQAGETVKELERRESAEHLGLSAKGMAELGLLLQTVGVADIGYLDGSPVEPEEASDTGAKARRLLAKADANLDDEMREIIVEFAEFCESAGRQGGFVVW